jgi:hypothetical protein
MKKIAGVSIIIFLGIIGLIFFIKSPSSWNHYKEDTLMHFEIDYPGHLQPSEKPSYEDIDSYAIAFGDEITISMMPLMNPIADSNLDPHMAVIDINKRRYIIWTQNIEYKDRLVASFKAL